MLNFKNDKVNIQSGLSSWIIFSPIALALIISLLIIFLSKFLPNKLPLFYSLPWGEKQLATNQQFLVIPGSIALVSLFNLIISWQLHQQQSFFKKILIFSSLIISLILMITFIKIVLIFI